MTPSVGRIVHFIPAPGADCQAAIVTKVWSPTGINVRVFAPGGGTDPAFTSVVESPDRDQPGFSWHWPERVE